MGVVPEPVTDGGVPADGVAWAGVVEVGAVLLGVLIAAHDDDDVVTRGDELPIVDVVVDAATGSPPVEHPAAVSTSARPTTARRIALTR